ncbi:unnamed protein product [Adineta ricciae]|uniref:Protein kinase domain-containing protein n=1 Tax=Adineta ricciae TaxID=249248 RepID=A0A815JRB8_ADIRI|nr:unnamed protein product [Adineta ricciae]CAF1419672.1 unnamed protein product [Adineta ricciae]
MGGVSSYPGRPGPIGHLQTSSGRNVNINGRPYFCEKRLGSGGFGAVYRSRAPNGTPVAVKVTRLSGTGRAQMEGRVEAFLNEVGQLNRLRRETRHVVVIHDFAFDPRLGEAYIVMELGNENLTTLIDRLRQMTGTGGGAIDGEMIHAFWQQMVSIVGTLHKNRIVHMDLKPDNFILFGTTLKIADLGIARKTSALGYGRLGTEGFSAPEVMRDIPGAPRYYTPKADIWSLGAILYYMVYGAVPGYHPAAANPPYRQRPYPDHLLVSMLRRTLVFHPNHRADIHEVANHPFTRQ